MDEYSISRRDSQSSESSFKSAFSSASGIDTEYNWILESLCRILRSIHFGVAEKLMKSLYHLSVTDADICFSALLKFADHVALSKLVTDSVQKLFNFVICNFIGITRYLDHIHGELSPERKNFIFRQIINSVYTTSEKSAIIMLNYISGRENVIEVLTDLTLSCSELPEFSRTNPDMPGFRIYEPFILDSGRTSILYPKEFGSGDGLKKGPILNSIEYVETPKCMGAITLMQEKYFNREGGYLCEVVGDPGVGKSVTACYAAQHWGSTFTWLSFQADSNKVYTVISRKHSVIASIISVQGATEIFQKRTSCQIVFLDGVTAITSELVRQALNWVALQETFLFVICSDAYQTYVNNVSIDSWSLDEFKKGMRVERFRKSIEICFARDSSRLSELLSCHETSREDIQDELDCFIEEKYRTTGGSARYMFAFKTSIVQNEIRRKILKLLDNIFKQTTNPGACKEINSVFIVSNGCTRFLSEFTEKCFLENRSVKELLELWNKCRSFGNGVLGCIFQRAIEVSAKLKQTIPLSNIHSNRIEQLTAEADFVFYSKVDYLISQKTKIVIEDGLVSKKSDKLLCPAPKCKKTYQSLKSLDTHLSDHKRLFNFDHRIPVEALYRQIRRYFSISIYLVCSLNGFSP